MFDYHVVLVEPEIPPNTGNAGRLCVATNSTLHVVGKLGFSLEDKEVRRAGLDYWKYVKLLKHDNLDDWFSWREKTYPEMPFYLFSKKATKSLYDISFPKQVAFIFGKETLGLADDILEKYLRQLLTIPMFSEKIRSLNLSNAVSIALYEAIRQNL